MATENQANQYKTPNYKTEFSQSREIRSFAEYLLLYRKEAGFRNLSNRSSRIRFSNLS